MTDGVQYHLPPSEFRSCYRRHLAKEYVCQACGRAYTHKATLARHVNFECGKEPRFICALCPYRSAQKANMFRHLRASHKFDLFSNKIPLEKYILIKSC